jgi:hypothetical protein
MSNPPTALGEALWGIPLRIKCLVIIFAVLAIAEPAKFAIPICRAPASDLTNVELTLVLFVDAGFRGIDLSAMLLLAIWLGLGLKSNLSRLLSTLLAVLCLSANSLLQLWRGNVTDLWTVSAYLWWFLNDFRMVLLFAAPFVFLRRWIASIRYLPAWEHVPKPLLQTSLSKLLVLTAIVGVLLALARVVASGSLSEPLPHAAGLALTDANFMIISYVATRAALSTGTIALRIMLALTFVYLFDVWYSCTLRQRSFFLELLDWSHVINVVPFAFIVASLLVVRSCGYRLVPKSLAAVLDEQRAPEAPADPLAT